MNRIKSISQKNNGGYNTPIPFGADGQYVDMASGFDLQQQLKLGGNHWTYTVQPTHEDPRTYIYEKYATYNYDNSVGDVTYSILTTISDVIEHTISIDDIEDILNKNDYLLENNDLPIVYFEQQKNLYFMNIKLYKGDAFPSMNPTQWQRDDSYSPSFKLIHEKQIIVTEDENGNTSIIEQVIQRQEGGN